MFRMRKYLAMFLCLSLLLVSLGSFNAFALDNPCDCGKTPTIFVNGMNSIPLEKQPGTTEAQLVFPPTDEMILNTIQNAVLPVLGKLFTQGLDGAMDAVADAVNELFDGLACKDNGDLPDGQGVNWSYPDVGRPHGYHFDFYYDWRQDPLVSAAQLADYVEYIKSETGHDKVSLIGFSMGGVVLNAYLHSLAGDYSGLQTVIMEVAAMNGASIASESFAGKIKVDSTALVRLFDDQLCLRNTIENILGVALRALDQTGMFDIPFSLANKLIEKYADKIYDQVFSKSFGTMPGVWGAVSDDYYEEAKEKLIIDKDKHADLIKRIDDYHYNMFLKNDELARALYEDPNVNFAVVLKYNRQLAPLIYGLNASSDGTVDAVKASYGATVADLDKTLGKSYVQANVLDGRNYLSADNKVDASTGTVPQATWFIRDLEHSTFCPYRNDLIDYLLNSPTQVTVFDNPNFPQFAYYDANLDDAFPITAESEYDPFEFLYDLGYGEAWFKLFARTAVLIANLT
ncbi:MAG TPA: hypothetical protein PKW24_07685 [Clostridiales bacterium]|nr:hypothetical protein [Clostridiales bacterium]